MTKEDREQFVRSQVYREQLMQKIKQERLEMGEKEKTIGNHLMNIKHIMDDRQKLEDARLARNGI